MQKSVEFCDSLDKLLKRKEKIRDAVRNCSNLGSTLNFTHKEGVIYIFKSLEKKIMKLLLLKPSLLTLQVKDCF